MKLFVNDIKVPTKSFLTKSFLTNHSKSSLLEFNLFLKGLTTWLQPELRKTVALLEFDAKTEIYTENTACPGKTSLLCCRAVGGRVSPTNT